MTKRNTALRFLGLALLIVAVYLPSLATFFHADDLALLESVKNGGPLGLWARPGAMFFRPMISLSLWLEWQLWGVHPALYHASNLLLHVLSACLVVSITKATLAWHRLELPPATPWLAGLFFGVLPGHAEAVLWISGRTDLIATLLLLLAYRLYLHESTAKPAFPWFALVFMASLLSKESGILFPALIFLAEALRTKTSPFKSQALLASAATLVLYLLLRRLSIGTFIGGYGSSYFQFIPFQLLRGELVLMRYSFAPLAIPSLWRLLENAAILGSLALAFLRTKPEGRRVLLLSASAFLLFTLPVMNLIGLAAVGGEGGRLCYLASAFAAILVPTVLGMLIASSVLRSVVLAALILACGTQTVLLARRWQEAGELMRVCLVQLHALPKARRLVLLAAPDVLNPAYVLRNGVSAGLVLLYGDPGREVVYAGRLFVDSVKTQTEAHRLAPQEIVVKRTDTEGRIPSQLYDAEFKECLPMAPGGNQYLLRTETRESDVLVIYDGARGLVETQLH